jgi:hypothetical protein
VVVDEGGGDMGESVEGLEDDEVKNVYIFSSLKDCESGSGPLLTDRDPTLAR